MVNKKAKSIRSIREIEVGVVRVKVRVRFRVSFILFFIFHDNDGVSVARTNVVGFHDLEIVIVVDAREGTVRCDVD